GPGITPGIYTAVSRRSGWSRWVGSSSPRRGTLAAGERRVPPSSPDAAPPAATTSAPRQNDARSAAERQAPGRVFETCGPRALRHAGRRLGGRLRRFLRALALPTSRRG